MPLNGLYLCGVGGVGGVCVRACVRVLHTSHGRPSTS